MYAALCAHRARPRAAAAVGDRHRRARHRVARRAVGGRGRDRRHRRAAAGCGSHRRGGARRSAARRFAVTRWRRLALAGTLRPMLETLAAHLDGAEPWVGPPPRPGPQRRPRSPLVGPPGGRPAAVVKRACTRAGKRALAAQGHALLDLAGRRSPVPRARASSPPASPGAGRSSRSRSSPGRPAGRPARRAACPGERFLAAVGAAIRAAPRARRATRCAVDDELLAHAGSTRRWRARAPPRGRSALGGWDAAIAAVRRELRGALARALGHDRPRPRRPLPRQRADATATAPPSPGSSTGSTPRGRGLPRGRPHAPARDDRAWQAEGRELGAVVAELLDGPFAGTPSRPPSARRARHCCCSPGCTTSRATSRSRDRYARSRTWVRRNVDPVLAAVLDRGRAAGAPARAAAAGRARRRAASRRPALVPRGGALGAALVLWPSPRRASTRAR